MSDPFRPRTTGEDLIDTGRGFAHGTIIPDWILLSASPPAVKLYLVLRMRINAESGHTRVWPGRATLAVMLDVKKSDTVTVYLKELEKLGAIDIERTKTIPAHNVYRINHSPPEAFAGYMYMQDWDHDPANKARAEAIIAYEKAKRDRSRGKAEVAPPARKAAPVRAAKKAAKPQVKQETRLNGSPETRLNGSQDTPPRGSQDTRSNGVEPLGVDLGGLVQVVGSSSCSEKEDEISSKPEDQEIEETAESVKKPKVLPVLSEAEAALAAELVAVTPTWSPLDVRRVLGSRRVREISARDPELVRRAFLIGARHAAAAFSGKTRDGDTTVPIRLWYVDRCPHWTSAARELAAERGEVSTPAPAPAPRPRRAPAPSAAQESPQAPVDRPLKTKAEALAYAAEQIAAGRQRAKLTAVPARPHAEVMADLDAALNALAKSQPVSA